MGKGTSALPKGWVWAKLGELANKVVGGGTPNKSISSFFNGDIPFMTVKDMNVERPIDTVDHITAEALDQSASNLIDPNTIIVATRMGLGKVVRVNFQTAINQDLKAIYFDDRFVNKDYIEKWYRKSADQILQLGTGTTVKGIRLEVLHNLNVPFPPLNEQKRIVAKIEELQSHSRRAKEALETIPELLEQLRQSILASAFRGDLTQKWREEHKDKIEPATELLKRIRIERRKRWEEAELEKLKAKGLTGDNLDAQFAKRRKQYKEPDSVDISGLPKLPKDWCWTSWNVLTEFITSGSRGWANYYSKSGSIFVRAQDIKTDELILKNVARVNLPQNAEGQRTRLRTNDILTTITGANVTKAAIVREELSEAFVSQHVALSRPVDNTISAFMHLWSISELGGRKVLLDSAYGGGKPGLNLDNLRQLPMPLPSKEEVAIIIKIVEHNLFKIDELRKKIEDAQIELDSLGQSILSKAFSGDLVPQDPIDEPASILLERIRQERERQAVERKPKPRSIGKKMKKSKVEAQDMITVLRKAARPMTPEELFAAGGFDEESVDSFYEELRTAIITKKICETRKGATIRMEALP